DGIGRKFEIDKKLLVNEELSILEGCINSIGENALKESSWSFKIFKALSEKYNFSLDEPFKNLNDEVKDIILNGVKEKVCVKYGDEGNTYNYKFEGIINILKRRYRDSSSNNVRQDIERYMSNKVCEKCNGARLKPEVLAVRFNGINIYELTCMSIEDSIKFLDGIELHGKNKIISEAIINEIRSRLSFLNNVGLSYLNLARTASTLSGGESQRIRLATQIGSSLVGVLYVLD
ncbi:Excinuclease ABC, A subunit, partial [Candidatus Arthromitus sp. SFB-4]